MIIILLAQFLIFMEFLIVFFFFSVVFAFLVFAFFWGRGGGPLRDFVKFLQKLLSFEALHLATLNQYLLCRLANGNHPGVIFLCFIISGM